MSDESELNRLRADLEAMERVKGLVYFGEDFKVRFYEKLKAIRDKIAKLEAEADPWREAKQFASTYRDPKGSSHLQKLIAHYDHLTAEVARLTERVGELEEINARLAKASEIYRDASWQSHNGHWDDTRQGGKGCLECVRANNLRDEADKILKGGE